MLFVNKIINSIIQIFLFALIPFVWWIISARKQQSFTQWIGLKKYNVQKKKVGVWIAGISLAFIPVGVFTLYIIQDVETATSEFTGMGVRAVPAILIYAIFHTAFPEELLFRGFLLKRLTCKFGFTVANAVQAFLFGLLHGIMFFAMVGMIKAILLIFFTGTIAWFMGYINEKKASGSIIPSWIIHSISNLFSGVYSAFLIL